MTRRMSVAERRARLGLRHRLAGCALASDPAEVARSVVAVHSTDPSSVYLAVLARMSSGRIADVERALYQDRTLIRLLGMRRTVFAVPVELAPAVQAACVRPVGERVRRTYLKAIVEAGLGDDAWLSDVADAAHAALLARGEATGSQLSTDEPRLRSQVLLAEGKSYEARPTLTTWVMILLAAEGRAARGRPVGSWSSSQWRWSPMEKWLPGVMPELSAAAARVELVRAWLAAFGPGTVDDLRWWTGWTAAQVRAALTEIKPVEVDLGGATGLVLPGDEAPVEAPAPWVALLPALDPTAMGWAGREWYLGPHAERLFDTTGNIGPSVWCDGRVVGGWVQRPDGEIAYRLLENVGRQAKRAIERQAGRLTDLVGPVRFGARGRRRSPLEQELLA